MNNVFSIENLHYAYLDGSPVLSGLSLDIESGERVAILGANGTGKSTLLSIMNGLAFPRSGSVRVFGKHLNEEALEDRSFAADFRKRVAFVFSNPDVQLFSSTVWDDIAFGPLQLNLSSAEVTEIVEKQLESLRIADLRDRAPHTLSDGQKKKVAIASSLATDPDVLLLDEPTNGLDPRTQVWLIELLWELHAQGKTIIAATHDLSIAGDITERAIVLSEDHTIAADGMFHDIIANNELLINVNLIHEHAHRHGDKAHVHRHGHFGHYHSDKGGMPDDNKYNARGHGSDYVHAQEQSKNIEDLHKLLVLIDHWIEHADSHAENYQEWAAKAHAAGESEVTRAIYLAIDGSGSVKDHLKRAKGILTEKLALNK